MALEEEECRDCQGRGVVNVPDDSYWAGWVEDPCLTCWGVGSVEVQGVQQP